MARHRVGFFEVFARNLFPLSFRIHDLVIFVSPEVCDCERFEQLVTLVDALLVPYFAVFQIILTILAVSDGFLVETLLAVTIGRMERATETVGLSFFEAALNRAEHPVLQVRVMHRWVSLIIHIERHAVRVQSSVFARDCEATELYDAHKAGQTVGDVIELHELVIVGVEHLARPVLDII